MFKIRKVEISGIGPFQKQSPRTFHFGPFFTLLRGKSGSGKTTVLQVLALLGHCNVMRKDASDLDAPEAKWERHARFTIVLGKCPFAGDERLKRLAGQWAEALGDKEAVELKFWIRLPHDIGIKEESLDIVLSTEGMLERCFLTGPSAHIDLVQEIIAFSRPKLKLTLEKAQERAVQGYLNQGFTQEPGNLAKDIIDQVNKAKPVFDSAPRSQYLENTEGSLPPLVAYFNTDMHDSGIGLDIRETPKRMSDDLIDLIVRRLHIVNEEGKIANEKEVRAFWSGVTRDPASKKTSTLIINIADGKQARIAIIEESINEFLEPGSKRAQKLIREFVSSGENQVLFLAIAMEALRPAHSIFMLDEPDLHMSLPAALRMFNKVYEKAFHEDMQIIAASHLSFVFPNSLHRKDELDSLESYMALYNRAAQEVGSGRPASRCVTLHWLSKDADKTELHSQEDAVTMAGKFQNYELDSIMRQSQIPASAPKPSQKAAPAAKANGGSGFKFLQMFSKKEAAGEKVES
jgi:hypothetical protein